ncbi:hypothetical protein ANN_02978 [Periplaneta americana]|uniref:Uncharacterized protein n=1 Tax=Periplaneta americana TaxID=6978 RepID=A0ABQ8TXR8_PERAM|nr:hypothetical protein ANN_02978 [Periplaneta americana]
MSPGSSTDSYPAFARIGLLENPGKNLNQITCPDRDWNLGHMVSRLDALTVTPQEWYVCHRKERKTSKENCLITSPHRVTKSHENMEVKLHASMISTLVLLSGKGSSCPANVKNIGVPQAPEPFNEDENSNQLRGCCSTAQVVSSPRNMHGRSGVNKALKSATRVVPENETADALAKKGTQVVTTSNHIISFNSAKFYIKRRFREETLQHHITVCEGRKWSSVLTSEAIPNHPRKESVATFRILSGQDLLAAHLHRFSILPSSVCFLCKDESNAIDWDHVSKCCVSQTFHYKTIL